MLLPMFSTRSRSVYYTHPAQTRAAVTLALRELNNKSDGIADWLLPRTRLAMAYRDSKCEEQYGLTGALEVRPKPCQLEPPRNPRLIHVPPPLPDSSLRGPDLCA